MAKTTLRQTAAVAREIQGEIPAEKRVAPRTLLLYRASAIHTSEHLGYCIIRNASDTGAMIEARLPLDVGSKVTLELTSGTRILGFVRWRIETSSGIEFDSPIELADVLKRSAGPRLGQRARHLPRLPLSLPGYVTCETGKHLVMLKDISTHGIRIECDGGMPTGPVSIALPRLGRVRARALWSDRDEAGCAFDRPFGLEELTDWINTVSA